jgi:hypothetical protein
VGARKLLQLAASNKAKKETTEAGNEVQLTCKKKDALKAQRQIAVIQETAAPRAALMRRDLTLPTLRNALQEALSAERNKEASKLKKLETVELITVFGAGGCNAADLLAESQKREGREEEDDDEDGAHGEE